MRQERVKAENKAEFEERRKKMKFTVQQRFVLRRMMPAEDEYFNMLKAREITEACGLTDDEQKIFESSTILVPGATITDWKMVDAKIPAKPIDPGEWLSNHFRSILKKQFDEKKIREDTIDLYNLFCGPPQE